MTVQFIDVPEKAREGTAGTSSDTVAGGKVYKAYFKRIFDITAVLMTLPVVVPFVSLMALLVALDGHNPFFVQKRVGRNGRIFSIFKLRSMVPNADRLLQKHLSENPGAREEYDRTQKLKKDPRITRIGAFIRRASIDELPQLLNVLRGDMSLVGPRPMLVSQVPLYRGSAYYRLRPGITGMWQVSERNECSFAERASYDTRYERRVSLMTDLRILAATVSVVLRCTGY